MKGQKQIYFLRPVGQRTPVKIGCSINPISRLAAIQIWSPTLLEIVAVTSGGHEFERDLHARFASDRLHGEWFSCGRELAELIADIAAGNPLPAVKTLPMRLNSRPDSAQVTVVIEQYLSGLTIKETAKVTGWSLHQVYSLLKKKGVQRRKQGQPRGVLDSSRVQQMATYRSQGETLETIGKRFQLTRERVRQLLDKHAYYARPETLTLHRIKNSHHVAVVTASATELSTGIHT